MKKIIVLLVVAVLAVCDVIVGISLTADRPYFLAQKRTIDMRRSAPTLSVLSYNVMCSTAVDKGERSWRNRASLICDILQESMPSIICLQENKKEQYEFFKKFLKGYDSVATYRDSTATAECLPIFFRKDLYVSEETKTFWLSDTPEKMSNTWGGAYNRICTSVVLRSRNGNERFVVANTHLDTKSAEIKQKSIRLICEKLSTSNLPTILAGDFNSKPKSGVIAFAKRYFADLGQGFPDENKGTFNNFNPTGKRRKIDYIMQLFGGFAVDNYQVIDKMYNNRFPSDHFPIYVELKQIKAVTSL